MSPLLSMKLLTLVCAAVFCTNLGRAAEFHAVTPGGDTECVEGDFSFFVREGATNNLVFDLEGGGACWNSRTCVPGELYKGDVDVALTLASLNQLNQGTIYDTSDERNPFVDWTHVYVGYCSADLHWGNNSETPYKIAHKGFANAHAALAHARELVPSPDKVLTTGCSAGGLATLLWGPVVIDAFPGAAHYVFADSFSLVPIPEIVTEGYYNWGLPSTLPTYAVPGLASLDMSSEEFLADIVSVTAARYPSARFSSFVANNDYVWRSFFEEGGGEDALVVWPRLMRQSYSYLLSGGGAGGRTSNTAAMIDAGGNHCVIPSSEFGSKEVDGVSLVQYLSDFVLDRFVPTLVDCGNEESCTACPAGGFLAACQRSCPEPDVAIFGSTCEEYCSANC